VIAAIGFVLSPLSWWNDVVVNVPLAYLFAWPFSAWDERLYVPAFVLGYWLTNIAGLVLLHKGIAGAVSDRKTSLDRLQRADRARRMAGLATLADYAFGAIAPIAKPLRLSAPQVQSVRVSVL
jgi:hypothetical protein